VDSFPRADDIEPPRISFMQRINHDCSKGDSSMTLHEFVDCSYLPWVESERRASTSKGYWELWKNHMAARIGRLPCGKLRSTVLVSLGKLSEAERELLQGYLRDRIAELSANDSLRKQHPHTLAR
jgi:hypothetical protein